LLFVAGLAIVVAMINTEDVFCVVVVVVFFGVHVSEEVTQADNQ
jgi:hypothetical protein